MFSFLQKNIFSINPRPFGLDLSDLSLKAVFMEQRGNMDVLSSFGSVPLPKDSVLDGEIIHEDAVITALETLLAKAGPEPIGTKQVVCSLPEIKSFLRIITLPIMGEEEAKEAVKWEIEGNIPLTLEQVYFDSQILPRSLTGEKDMMSMLVVAVSRTIVDQFVATLEKANLEVVGLETESIAQIRCLLSEEDSDQTVLIVDIGDRRTSFLISIGNIPCFTSSVSLSSQMITDAISKTMKISFEEAEAIKIANGIGSFVRKDPLFLAVQPVLENLAMEIERSIEFYRSNLRYSSSVDTLMLCGGGANMQGLSAYLTQRLGLTVERGDPWTNIRLGNQLPIIDRQKSIQYSTAIGLALRNVKTYGY